MSTPDQQPAPLCAFAPTIPASFTTSTAAFLASHPAIHFLLAGAIVFSPSTTPSHSQPGATPLPATASASIPSSTLALALTLTSTSASQQQQPPPPPSETSPTPTAPAPAPPPLPRVLLVRRAPSDSYPLTWEVPGGSVDPTDASLVSAAARELLEESGLRATRAVCAVGTPSPSLSSSFSSSSSRPATPPVKSPGDRILDSSVWPEGDLVYAFEYEGRVWAKLTFIFEVDESRRRRAHDGTAAGREETPEVVLDPEEHVEWAWVTEGELRRGKFADGRHLEVLSEPLRRTILEGFRLRNARD